MFYVVSQLWIFLLSIFVVGVLTAVLVRQPEERRWMAPWLKWALLAFVAAAAVATIGAFSGRAGFYVESGLASFAAFLLGGFVGTRFTRGSLREHKGWALGLVPAIMIWWVGNAVTTPRLEADLKQKVGKAIEAANADASKLEIAGRDVILPDDLANSAALVDSIQDVDGVRLVVSAEKLKEALTARRETPPPAAPKSTVAPVEKDVGEKEPPAQRQERAPPVAAPQPPVAAPQPQIAAPQAPVAPPQAPAVAPPAPAPAPQPPKEAAQPAPTQLSLHEPTIAELGPPPPEPEMPLDKTKAAEPMIAPPAVGALNATACQAALSAALANDKVQFGTGNAKIRFVSTPLLDKVAVLLKRCPGAKFEIGVHTDASGAENAALTQRRAERLVEYLEREGIEHGRLVGVGYGAKKPLRSNDGEANRRVEFQVK